jgi:hypothetical protein
VSFVSEFIHCRLVSFPVFCQKFHEKNCQSINVPGNQVRGYGQKF